MDLLTVDKLSMCFHKDGKKLQALQDISFTLQEGEILALIGESGSGKSTIANCLMGLHRPTSGTMYLGDDDAIALARRHPKRLYKKVQMVFQDAVASFNPRRSIGDSIGESLDNLCGGEGKDKIGELLESVGLKGEHVKAYPHQLSGGQCQRAAIARAMAVKPKILVCDEATSALDVSVQATIMDLLVSLQKETGLSLLFISHDLPLVSAVADRAIILNKGRIEEMGAMADILKAPQSAYTEALLDAVL